MDITKHIIKLSTSIATIQVYIELLADVVCTLGVVWKINELKIYLNRYKWESIRLAETKSK